ncbi:MAG: alpha/beta hydrolase fold domain-containing protein [Clostridia bacterium]|nr:alpha/beta hydrolase fold domain-containing protein [Clostridia bacterium]
MVASRVALSQFPDPLSNARKAVSYVWYNAEKFEIDKNKIAVMSPSAGEHLAALLCTYKKEIISDRIRL